MAPRKRQIATKLGKGGLVAFLIGSFCWGAYLVVVSVLAEWLSKNNIDFDVAVPFAQFKLVEGRSTYGIIGLTQLGFWAVMMWVSVFLSYRARRNEELESLFGFLRANCPPYSAEGNNNICNKVKMLKSAYESDRTAFCARMKATGLGEQADLKDLDLRFKETHPLVFQCVLDADQNSQFLQTKNFDENARYFMGFNKTLHPQHRVTRIFPVPCRLRNPNARNPRPGTVYTLRLSDEQKQFLFVHLLINRIGGVDTRLQFYLENENHPFIKGADYVLVPRCRTFHQDGRLHLLDFDETNKIIDLSDPLVIRAFKVDFDYRLATACDDQIGDCYDFGFATLPTLVEEFQWNFDVPHKVAEFFLGKLPALNKGFSGIPWDLGRTRKQLEALLISLDPSDRARLTALTPRLLLPEVLGIREKPRAKSTDLLE